MFEDVRWFVDPYREWLDREGLPVVEGLAVHLMDVETGPWPRLGMDAAVVHLEGKGDYMNVYVADLASGASSEPVRHLYETVTYVLEGQGNTKLTFPDGTSRTFEWGRGSLFAVPLNVQYQHFNASGNRRVRLANASTLPLLMKYFRDENFVFDTPFDFAHREVSDDSLQGQGTLIRTYEHRHMWETSLVPDLLQFDEMQNSPSRGTGSKNVHFILGDGTMHAHVSEIPTGHYKKAHKHPADFHIIQLSGQGYSLYWNEGEELDQARRVDWQHGTLHAPPDFVMHQHFNTGGGPARYMAAAFGSLRYPFSAAKWAQWERKPTDKSPYQIEYEDEDPRIRAIFDEERAKASGGPGA